MAKLIADRNEYRDGYKKNYQTFMLLYKRQESPRSRRMLLAYSNECGLKYLLLRKWQILFYKDIEDIMKNKADPKNEIITTHDLEKLIKELGFAGEFKFPTKLKTERDIRINADNFHQYCRYGIKARRNSEEDETAFEKTLMEIGEWIENMIEQGVL